MGRQDAIRHCDQLNAVALQPAVELERLHKVSGQARQIVDQDDGKEWHGREGGRYEALVGRPMLDSEPGHGRVLIDVVLEDFPSALSGKPPAVADLVLQRGRPLHLGAEPGVDGTTLHVSGVSWAGSVPTVRLG